MAGTEPDIVYLKASDEFSVDDVEKAGQVLHGGGVIALPTDTLYGVASLAQSSDGIRRLYEVKQRDTKKPLAICVGEIEDINRWAVVRDDTVLRDLLPGSVTVLLSRRPELNPDLNPGVTSVGIRIPAHQFIRRLANFCREPLALTSANTSNKPSTVAIEEFKELWPKLDLIVDGGTIQNPSRLGSTVVDISQPKLFTIIRSGSVYDETRHLLRDKYGLQEITSSQK